MGGPYLPEECTKTHGRYSRRVAKVVVQCITRPFRTKNGQHPQFSIVSIIAHQKLVLLFPRIPDPKSLYLCDIL